MMNPDSSMHDPNAEMDEREQQVIAEGVHASSVFLPVNKEDDPRTRAKVMSLRDQYHTYGYVLLPNVFTPEEIDGMRAECEQILEAPSEQECDLKLNKNGKRWLSIDTMNRFDGLRWAGFQQPFVEGLREILAPEKVARVPEDSLMALGYSRHGFHVDLENYQKTTGVRTTFDEGNKLVRPVIYLQENSEEHGGGLDIVPGTHKRPWRPEDEAVRIRHEVGDVLMFSMHIRHQGTQAKNEEHPLAKRKMGLFMAAGPDNEHTRRFAKHLRETDRSLYMDFLRPFYQIHPETLRLAAQHDIHWLTGTEHEEQ